jgi:hypothetical protein
LTSQFLGIQKLKAILYNPLTFFQNNIKANRSLHLFVNFGQFFKQAKNDQNNKGLPFTFLPNLASFSKTQNMAKIGQKLNANPLTFFQKKSWLTPLPFHNVWPLFQNIRFSKT